MLGSVADWVSNSWTASQDNPADPILVESIDAMPAGPAKDAYSRQCHSQRVLSSAAVQNFKFAGVLLVLIVSLLLTALGLFLEPLVRCLRHWRPSRVGEVRQLAREMDSRDHLLRMALEGADIWEWKVGALGIPVIREMAAVPEVIVEDGLGRYLAQVSGARRDTMWKGY